MNEEVMSELMNRFGKQLDRIEDKIEDIKNSQTEEKLLSHENSTRIENLEKAHDILCQNLKAVGITAFTSFCVGAWNFISKLVVIK